MRIFTEAHSNAKTDKASKLVETAILHLSPSTVSGYNVCPLASEGCKKACLNTAGRGTFDNVQTARLNRTLLYFQDREAFWVAVIADIETLRRRARKSGKAVAVRLNGTSDIMWERQQIPEGGTIFERFPDVTFYDYTKIPGRKTPSNYHLTFSLSEDNKQSALAELSTGRNVAVVFRDSLPSYYLGKPVVSGEKTDLRYQDPKGVVVGLIAKGKAKKDVSGFVQSY